MPARSAMRSNLLAILIGVIAAIGCSAPSKANIELRRQNHQQREEIEALKRRHEADAATIRGLESRRATIAALPQAQLDKLFTVHGLQFGRLTGADDKEIKVYLVPT